MPPATTGKPLQPHSPDSPGVVSIDYPGPHDFVLIASDGVKFNLSRVVLIATSGFFADMFTVGESVSQTRLPEESAVNAAEGSSVFDALFSISYAHPSKPKPAIDSFSQLANLLRVAEKYAMHQALDYLSAQLVLPRIVAGITVEPFTVTHPVVSLALATMHGFTMPARLALREVLNARTTVWDITQEDKELEGVAFDYRIVKHINMMRTTRSNAYRTFIESLVPCTNISCTTKSLALYSLSNWKIQLLKKINEERNAATFTAAFITGSFCQSCGVNVNNPNWSRFQTFMAGRAAQEAQLPQLY